MAVRDWGGGRWLWLQEGSVRSLWWGSSVSSLWWSSHKSTCENGEELVHTRRSALKTGEPEKSQWITSKSVMQDVITGEKWRIYKILQMHVNLQIFQNAKFFKTSLLSVYSVLTREQALPCLTGLWKRVCKGIHLYSKD